MVSCRAGASNRRWLTSARQPEPPPEIWNSLLSARAPVRLDFPCWRHGQASGPGRRRGAVPMRALRPSARHRARRGSRTAPFRGAAETRGGFLSLRPRRGGQCRKPTFAPTKLRCNGDSPLATQPSNRDPNCPRRRGVGKCEFPNLGADRALAEIAARGSLLRLLA